MCRMASALGGLIFLVECVPPAYAAEPAPIAVGAAKIDVTPAYGVRLSGYSSRRKESEGVAQKIWAKALAIGGDERGPAALLITVDTCGMPASLVEAVCGQLVSTGLRREQLVVCASHSHSCPWLQGYAPFLASEPVPPEHEQHRAQYTRELQDKLVDVARQALAHRQPARLYWAQGKVAFAANRRVLKDGRWTGFGVQADGPVDHRLPLLVAKNLESKPVAIWANYACHCTTLGGDFNQICGDWAGYAQEGVESDTPGAIALISIGCGADANPHPRGILEQARQHGRALADEVQRLLAGELRPVAAAVSCRFAHVDLPFAELPTKEQWEQMAKTGGPSGDRARYFLQRIERGQPVPKTLSYPVTTWVFGDDVAMVFLGGEVVVDYAIRLSAELASERLWVTAYANDVPCYIPSKRILREGGYEADSSMIYYGQPTRFAPEIEDVLVAKVRELLAREAR